MRQLIFALLLLCAACGPLPPSANLPADAVTGAGDPMRVLILRSAHAFGRAATLAGQPAAAARALADMEYLAAELPQAPRWYEMPPQVGFDLAAARQEWRAALGIAPGTAPQPIIDAFYGLARGETPPLPASSFPAPAETLARLAALPPLPRTSLAAARAQEELTRMDQQGRMGQGGDSGAGLSN